MTTAATPTPRDGEGPGLLSCAHCGGQAIPSLNCAQGCEHPHAVVCDACGIGTLECSIMETAIAAWNRRAPDPRPAPEPDLIGAMMRGAEKSGGARRLSCHDYKCMADEILAALKGPA